jgi:hypothetical protein
MASTRKTYSYEVNAILWVSRKRETLIRDLLERECNVPEAAIRRGLHLTIYHGRRFLPDLVPSSKAVHILADALETRFMVMAPGGENPRPYLEPGRRSVGIRLTRRNCAVPQIQKLRSSVYSFETESVVGDRKPTSAWTNCFGARHFQPHITLLRPGSGIHRDLTKLGEIFRSEMEWIEFNRFEIRCGPVRASLPTVARLNPGYAPSRSL